METALQVLQLQVEVCAAARETANRAAIAKLDRHHLVARSDTRCRIAQHLADVADRHLAGHIREVGTNGLPSSMYHMALAALAFAEEKFAAAARRSGHAALGRSGIE